VRFRLVRRGKRIGIVLVLAWLLVAAMMPLLNMAVAENPTFQVNPIDDAFADFSNPDANYGSSSLYEIDTYDFVFLKFNLSDFSLPVERIVSAKIRVYNPNSEENYGTLKACVVTDDSWGEEQLTYNNKPAISSYCSAEVTPTSPGWTELDVTSILSYAIDVNDKIASFALDYYHGSSSVTIHIASKEYAQAEYWPQLVIEYEPYTQTQTEVVTETVTVTETTTETITETATATTTVTDYVTETQTITTTPIRSIRLKPPIPLQPLPPLRPLPMLSRRPLPLR